MKEIRIHLIDGHCKDIHFNSGEGTPIEAFVLITSVPTTPPAQHILAYGSSETVGKMLFSFWKNSVEKDPEGAWVLEQVARDIISAADSERNLWPEEITDQIM